MWTSLKKLLKGTKIRRDIEEFIDARIENYLYNQVSTNNIIEKRIHKQLEVQAYAIWDVLKHLDINKIEKKLSRQGSIYCYTDSQLSVLIFTSTFEENELHFVEKFLKNGDSFADVGANIGLFSIVAGYAVGTQGKVYALEPVQKTYLRLEENKQLNQLSNIETFNLAFSDTNQNLNMTISLDGYDAWNSLGKPSEGSNFTQETIQGITMDDFIQQNPLFEKVSLMKIDVEGWENKVLLGGRKWLESSLAPTLLIEFNDQNAANAGTSCQEIYHLLEELGYKLYEYEAHKEILHLHPLKNHYLYNNLIATKNKIEVEKRLQSE